MSAKWSFHSNSVINATHAARNGRYGSTRNEVTISEPTPARPATDFTDLRGSDTPRPGGSGGQTRVMLSTLVVVFGGMIFGRLFGLAKNRNTCSNGNDTHCLNWKRRAMCCGLYAASCVIVFFPWQIDSAVFYLLFFYLPSVMRQPSNTCAWARRATSPPRPLSALP